MATSLEIAEIALRSGQAKKRNNAIAAVLCGALPAILLAHYDPRNWKRWLAGLIVGIVWGNAFEYSYHRWLLHRPKSFFSEGHREHHAQIGTPGQAEHVTLGSSPLDIVVMFATNGVLAVLIDLGLHLGIAPGIFIAWTIYLIATEEIHWRIHMNEWLPPGLSSARAYHMRHHDIPTSRYNIFLPLFDWLFGVTA